MAHYMTTEIADILTQSPNRITAEKPRFARPEFFQESRLIPGIPNLTVQGVFFIVAQFKPAEPRSLRHAINELRIIGLMPQATDVYEATTTKYVQSIYEKFLDPLLPEGTHWDETLVDYNLKYHLGFQDNNPIDQEIKDQARKKIADSLQSFLLAFEKEPLFSNLYPNANYTVTDRPDWLRPIFVR